MNKLFCPDQFIKFNMELAVMLGDDRQALLLSTFNYWIERNERENINFKDGYHWVYNSYKGWQEKYFPCWSESKVKKLILELEKQKILISDNHNKLAIDKTKWYRINHTLLEQKYEEFKKERPLVQNELSNGSKQTVEQSEMNQPLPESTSKNTSSSSICDESGGMPTSDRNGDSVPTEEVPHTSSADDVSLIADEFLRLRGGFFLSPRDQQEVIEVVEQGVKASDAIVWLSEIFTSYNANAVHNRKKISSFSYCSPGLLDRHYAKYHAPVKQANTSRTKKQHRLEDFDLD